MSVRRGSIPFEGTRRLRYEVSESASTPPEWGFIWAHGLTSSVRSENEGGWPYRGISSLVDVLPVARFDARGHGASDSSESTFSWPAMGSDLLHLRAAWGRRHTVLGGTSMGCAASLHAVVKDPSGVRGLILANPPTCFAQRAKFVPMYLESATLARAEGLEAAKVAAAAKARPPIFLATEQGRSMFDIGWREKIAMGPVRYCAAMEGSAASDLPPKELLRSIEVPALVLAWQSDVQHPVDSAKLLASTLPNAELHIARSWDEIEDFPRIMRAFLSRLLQHM